MIPSIYIPQSCIYHTYDYTLSFTWLCHICPSECNAVKYHGIQRQFSCSLLLCLVFLTNIPTLLTQHMPLCLCTPLLPLLLPISTLSLILDFNFFTFNVVVTDLVAGLFASFCLVTFLGPLGRLRLVGQHQCSCEGDGPITTAH